MSVFTYQNYEADNNTVAPITSLLYFHLEAHISAKILSLFFVITQHIPRDFNEDYRIHLHRYYCLSRHLFDDFTGFKEIMLLTVFILNIKYQH